jgi:2-desacetyl-2-hydroxyethyl bacteriochlorophyllide A dehydrogenase
VRHEKREGNMKAIVIHGPSQISIDDVDIKKPDAGEVLVKVKAVGICNTDYELYTNEMFYITEGISKLPMIPGHEWSGVVDELGEGVTDFAVGDKVCGECTVSCGSCYYCVRGIPNQCTNRTETGIMNRDGAFAEYITFPVSHLHRFRNISFPEAAMVETSGVAYYAVRSGGVGPMDNVLVTGPGAVGLMAAQIAKKVFNAKRVILSGTRSERLEKAGSFGLDGLVNIREDDLEEKVREFTNGEMIDVVIEESGGSGVFADIKKIINPCGRVVLNGFFGAREAPIQWDAFTVKDVKIIGTLGSPNVWDDVIHLLDTGKITSSPLVTHRMGLLDFEKGLDTVINRKENVCKVVIEP